jgi:hypothetical protein
MADTTISDGLGGEIDVDTITLSGGEQVQTVHWVFASEGGAAVAVLKQEDAAHTSEDYGLPVWGVRKDTASALAGSDGDYIPMIFDSSGRLHVAVGSMPAAGRATDTISAALATDVFMDELTARTPGRAAVSAANSGNNTLLAAQGEGNAIRVHGIFLIAGDAVTVTIEDGAGGTDLSGPIPLVANVGFVLPISSVPWIVGSDNTLLNLSLSAAEQVSGLFVYTVA